MSDHKKKPFVSFEIAKQYLHEQKLKNVEEYHVWSRSSRPELIPSSPKDTYKNEWTSWGDYLGTGNQWNKTKKFWDYIKCKEWLKDKNITSVNDFTEKRAKGLIPEEIPSHPENYFK